MKNLFVLMITGLFSSALLASSEQSSLILKSQKCHFALHQCALHTNGEPAMWPIAAAQGMNAGRKGIWIYTADDKTSFFKFPSNKHDQQDGVFELQIEDKPIFIQSRNGVLEARTIRPEKMDVIKTTNLGVVVSDEVQRSYLGLLKNLLQKCSGGKGGDFTSAIDKARLAFDSTISPEDYIEMAKTCQAVLGDEAKYESFNPFSVKSWKKIMPKTPGASKQ